MKEGGQIIGIEAVTVNGEKTVRRLKGWRIKEVAKPVKRTIPRVIHAASEDDVRSHAQKRDSQTEGASEQAIRAREELWFEESRKLNKAPEK